MLSESHNNFTDLVLFSERNGAFLLTFSRQTLSRETKTNGRLSSRTTLYTNNVKRTLLRIP